MQLEIPNPDEPENDGQAVRHQFQRAFPGLAGESRLSDGNNQFFHAGATAPAGNVRPGPPPDGGSQPFPHRPDVPCETQELPDLHAPGRPDRELPAARARTAGAEVEPRRAARRAAPSSAPSGASRARAGRRSSGRGRSTGARAARCRAGALTVRQAVRKHLPDFLAIVGVVVLGLGVGAYVLANQRLRFPLIEEKPFSVRAELPDAQAVTPGQGQTVVVAGVRVGDIGDVELEDGHAVVELQLERKHEGLLREDATALLRAKTGTKDMFVEVDPGRGRSRSRTAGASSSRTRCRTSTRTSFSPCSTRTRATT